MTDDLVYLPNFPNTSLKKKIYPNFSKNDFLPKERSFLYLPNPEKKPNFVDENSFF